MSDLITTENLSKEILHSIFEAAFMSTSWDDDGDLRVKDQISCFVLPSKTGNRIRLMTMFGFKESATEMQRLECVNNINREYLMVRAISGTKNNLILDHDIFVEGGICKKTIVLATKFFLSIPLDAINDHGASLVR